MDEFDPARLDERRSAAKFIIPKMDAGAIGVILTLLGGLWWFSGELKETRLGLLQVKADTVAESARNKEAIAAVASDVKDVRSKVNDMSETLAVIRATQLQRGTESGKK
jgi:hypothetical protein